MTRTRKYFTFVAISISLAFIISGCTVGSGAYPKPQSHFDFPNSNVIPLGKAHGEASTVSFFYPDIANPDVEEEAILNALREKGGDLLIDYTYFYKVTMIPLPYLPIYSTTIQVDGTACKMEIGQQILK